MSRLCYCLLGIAIVVAVPTATLGAPSGPSIAINFGTEFGEEPNAVLGAAGVLRTENWNNVVGPMSEGPVGLVADVNGVSPPISTTVEWSTYNTWASEGLQGDPPGSVDEPNDAPAGSPDRALMLGYLDGDENISRNVNIEGLGPEFTGPGYDLYVYILGDNQNVERGGGYAISGDLIFFDDENPFVPVDRIEDVLGDQVIDFRSPGTARFDGDGDYVLNENYILFENLSTPNLNLQSIALYQEFDPNNPGFQCCKRAPINGIEIVARPDVVDVDLDDDNDVDGADFLLIQQTDPSLIPEWEAQYPSSLSALSSVPEPTSLVLLVSTLMLGIGRRRR